MSLLAMIIKQCCYTLVFGEVYLTAISCINILARFSEVIVCLYGKRQRPTPFGFIVYSHWLVETTFKKIYKHLFILQICQTSLNNSNQNQHAGPLHTQKYCVCEFAHHHGQL